MKKMTLATLSVAAILFVGCADKAQHTDAHWVYKGEMGPANWGKISATCAEGKAQSPINIISENTISLSAENILEFHEATEAVLSHEVDNGHAIKITPEDDHGISIEGEHFKLLQFHYHGRSENLIDGKQFDMEMHLVHQNSKGKLAVVAIMIEEGAHSPAYEKVVDHINGGDLEVATAALLPTDITKYYHFIGSLTTPPCSENVKWYVLKDTVTLDAKQIAAFRTHHDDNFRPVQDLNGRLVQSK